MRKKIEFIIKEDFSLPRNPTIAKIFRHVKFSENIGSGFNKMIGGWNVHYHLKPLIEGDFDYYKITFPTTTTNTTTKTTTKDKEKEILELIRNNPHLTSKEIGELVGLSINGVRYHIKNLKRKQLLERTGGSKKGYWKTKRK